MIRARNRRFLWLLLGAGLLAVPSTGRAQFGIGNIAADPFAFYYAYYLPNQQMQAMRPRPDDVINQAVQQRQYYAATQKPTLYDPISPYASNPGDPSRPYSRDNTIERSANPYRFSQDPTNSNGTGPSLYYGRASQYFPSLRAGRGPNANVGSGARRMGGGGRNTGGFGGMGAMGGMGGMGGMGMPGMPG